MANKSRTTANLVSNTGISTFTDLNITRVNISGVGTISNGSITNLTGTSSTITTFRSTTLNADTGNIVTGVTTNFTSTNGSITSLTGTAATITTLRSTTGNFTTGNIVTGVTTNFNATNVVITGVTTVSAGTALLPSISPSGDPNTGIFFPAADHLNFSTGGTSRVQIESDGDINIDSGGVFYDATNNRLAIGTTSPSKKLEVAGDILMTGSDGFAINLGINAGSCFLSRGGTLTSNVQFGGTTSNIDIGSGGGFQIVLGKSQCVFNSFPDTANAGQAITLQERMRINSAGQTLIGTTSASFGCLSVFDNALSSATQQALIYAKSTQSGDASLPGLYIVKFANDTTTSQVLVKFGHNNGTQGLGQINANGASEAAFGSFSDHRLKENIVELPSQLENLCSLRPVEFDFKDGSGHQIGFIAQEMQAVYPDAVAEGDNEMLTITGWGKTQARIVKALQEAIAKIETLEQRLTAAGID